LLATLPIAHGQIRWSPISSNFGDDILPRTWRGKLGETRFHFHIGFKSQSKSRTQRRRNQQV
jgi:hypothetical protein